jgi:hypothetical protein
VSADHDIDSWLAGRGISLPDSRALARAVLEEAGLTRPGKVRISDMKLPRAEELLDGRFFRVCGAPDCMQVARYSGREPLVVQPRTHCERCGGSNNRRAEVTFLEACRHKQVRRVVVVGGSPAVREELGEQLGDKLELRMVDGTERRTSDRARHDLEWADLVLVWGGTELHHKVSGHYMHGLHSEKVVHVARRGVAALLAEAVEHLQRRG